MDLDSLRRFAAEGTIHAAKGGAIVYHPAPKRLFALNAAAALVWLNLRDGATQEAVTRELAATFALSTDEAAHWATMAFASLSEASASTPEQADATTEQRPTGPSRAGGVDYRLLGQVLRIDAPDEAQRLIDSVLGALRLDSPAAASEPVLVVEVVEAGAEYQILSDGEPLATAAENGLVAEIERLIFSDIVPKAPHFLAFHAALLKRHGQALLFPAPSGSGKTTLGAVLASQGWSYGSDEMALLTRDLLWRGLPLPPCVKAGNYDRVQRWYPDLGKAPEHHRFGRQVKYLPLAAQHFLAPVGNVVFPRFDPGAATQLDPVEPLDGLARLLKLCTFVPLGFQPSDVDRLVAWHDAASYFSLSFGDPLEAAVLLDNWLLGEARSAV